MGANDVSTSLFFFRFILQDLLCRTNLRICLFEPYLKFDGCALRLLKPKGFRTALYIRFECHSSIPRSSECNRSTSLLSVDDMK